MDGRGHFPRPVYQTSLRNKPFYESELHRRVFIRRLAHRHAAEKLSQRRTVIRGDDPDERWLHHPFRRHEH